MKYIISPEELEQLTKAPEPWFVLFLPVVWFYIVGILISVAVTHSWCRGLIWPLELLYRIIF